MTALLKEVGPGRVALLALGVGLLFTPWVPLHILLSITCLNLALRENYPFSHFPMFASFSPTTEYFFLTDHSDQLIASDKELGISAGTLKKRYCTTRGLVARDQPMLSGPQQDTYAGVLLLRSLLASTQGTNSFSRLRLYQSVIGYDSDGVFEEVAMLAEVGLD